MKIIAGDRVRLIRDGYGIPPGAEGTVDSAKAIHTQCDTWTTFDGFKGSRYFPGEMLELVSRGASTIKATNPKDAIGSQKIPLHLWPTTATVYGSMALLDGACKYGRNNWRAMGVRSTVYADAAMRHLFRYMAGEDNDPDSGLPQLAMVLACVAILVDAKEAGKLNDDREFPGGLVPLIERMTPEVARIKERYKDKTPHHYSAADAASETPKD